MSARAWLVDTDSESWVFSYEQDARDKAHDLFHDGEDEAAVVPLVPETDLDKLRAEVASLRAFRDGVARRVERGHSLLDFGRDGDLANMLSAALAGRGPEARGDYDPACTICRTERRKCSACAKPSPDVRGPFVPVTRVGDGLSDTFVRLSHLRGLLEAVDAVGERWERNPDLPVPRQFMVALAAKRKEWP